MKQIVASIMLALIVTGAIYGGAAAISVNMVGHLGGTSQGVTFSDSDQDGAFDTCDMGPVNCNVVVS